MVSSFALTPYIKNFYRAKDTVIIDLQRRFFKFGWIYAIFMGLMMFIALSMIYQLTFTVYQYLLGVLFMIPLFLHILLISEYYKKNLQTKIDIAKALQESDQISASVAKLIDPESSEVLIDAIADRRIRSVEILKDNK